MMATAMIVTTRVMPMRRLSGVGSGLPGENSWAMMLVRRFRLAPPGPVFNHLLASTAKFQLGFGLLLCAGVLIGRGF